MPTRLFTTQPLARIYHRPQHAQIQRHRLRKSRPIRATLRAATGAGLALGTASFVELSKSDTAGTSETAETRMLEVSRWDLSQRRRVADDDSGLSRIRHGIVYLWMTYVWEPVATCVRFVQLVVVFVPVIVALPAIWVGKRQPERDGERSGTLWWYGFLVKSMEWAGPAFIKVST